MLMQLIHSQIRRIGIMVLFTPILVAIAVAIAGWFASQAWPATQATVLINWLVQIFVISAGVCTVGALTGDQLIELHESTPIGFHKIQLLRACLITLAGAVGAAIMFFPLYVLRIWPGQESWVLVFSPLGAVIIVLATALVTAAFGGSAATTTIAVVMAWMFLSLLWDPYVLPLLPQRGIPLLFSGVLIIAAWYRLKNAELNIAKVASV